MAILVTGGTGYIGSHTCVALLNAGFEVVIVDNLSNSHRAVLERIETITSKPCRFVEADLNDRVAMEALFRETSFDAVVHFAGLKAVGESVAEPVRYYRNNVSGTLTLLEVMQQFEVFKLVFSSSATVYGDPAAVPITESAPLQATNPYGQSKLMIELMLKDLAFADDRWRIIPLRYFNPVGAHASGLIGEDPQGIPNNLMPFISQVAVGKREGLQVFGSDYPTVDGTGVRDYIHVVDLADGHIKALQKLDDVKGCVPVNLGTGTGYSVLQMVKAFEKANAINIPYRLTERRPGDIAACYADPAFAKSYLNWEAKLDLEAMTRDAWHWQSRNPSGYLTE